MAMEDWNTLAADCVVISCCCQCLILQILIFVLLKLPCKLIRKTKQLYAEKKKKKKKKKRKLRHGRKEAEKIIETLKGQYQNKCWEFQVHGHGDSSCCCCCVHIEGYSNCMQEVEKVLEEFSEKGEFAFGSFWGRERSRSCSSTSLLAQQEFDQSVVQYEVVELVASLTYS